jgi:hypothetical protein
LMSTTGFNMHLYKMYAIFVMVVRHFKMFPLFCHSAVL